MPNSTQIATALYGAWRLLRLDPAGMGFFEQTPDGFFRSFYAALLVAPGYLILILIHLTAIDSESGNLRILLVEGIAYVISWTAFPLLMFRIADAIGRTGAYIGFIVAFNWSKVIQMAIYLPVSLVTFSGLLPEALSGMINVATSLGILGYQWFITRTALDVGGLAAVGLVVLDLIIGVIITAVADGMIS